MTRVEAIECVTYLMLRYPSQKMTELAIEAFAESLADFPAALAKPAVEKLAKTNQWFPSLAEIITAIVDLHIDLPGPEAAWNEILRRNTEDDWQNLDSTIRTALRAAGGTHALSHDEAHFVRRAFLESYTALRKERADSARDADLPKIERARLTVLPKGRNS